MTTIAPATFMSYREGYHGLLPIRAKHEYARQRIFIRSRSLIIGVYIAHVYYSDCPIVNPVCKNPLFRKNAPKTDI